MIHHDFATVRWHRLAVPWQWQLLPSFTTLKINVRRLNVFRLHTSFFGLRDEVRDVAREDAFERVRTWWGSWVCFEGRVPGKLVLGETALCWEGCAKKTWCCWVLLSWKAHGNLTSNWVSGLVQSDAKCEFVLSMDDAALHNELEDKSFLVFISDKSRSLADP